MSNLKSRILEDFGVTGKEVLKSGLIRKSKGLYVIDFPYEKSFKTQYEAVKYSYEYNVMLYKNTNMTEESLPIKGIKNGMIYYKENEGKNIYSCLIDGEIVFEGTRSRCMSYMDNNCSEEYKILYINNNPLEDKDIFRSFVESTIKNNERY